MDAWLSVAQYDPVTQNAFVGDYKGNIHVLKIMPDGKLTAVNILSGHAGKPPGFHWHAHPDQAASKVCCGPRPPSFFTVEGANLVYSLRYLIKYHYTSYTERVIAF